MWTRRSTLAGAALLLAGTLSGGSAAADTLRIGAMPVGSGWYVAAATLEQYLQPVLEDHTVEVIARGGGVANPMVVEAGRAEIALSNTATAVWARDGHELYDGQTAPSIRALLGGLNPVFFGAMVREEFLQRTGLETLDEILDSDVPLRIVMKPQGSNVPPSVDMMLEAHGIDRDTIIARGGEIIQVDTAQIPAVLRDGRADILFDTILRGHPMLTEVWLTGNVRFIDLSERAMENLAENGMRQGQIPEWFEGQDGPVWGSDYGTILIAHESVPEDVAYTIVKAFIENADAMAEAYPAWQAFVPEDAWKPENTGIELHPGAERYYRERGWM